ncbi:MAG: nucleotidyltransferase family protein [Thermoprotei archaeon]|nr:MAG: nucleotidyltransferase family protein [Thermoprotei archaeon]RLF16487.1 MAG: nucleotidyltransferase family protein [Thermoprotei archaeon]
MIAIIVLAAGKSTRFAKNKLLALVDGEAMIRRVAKEALHSMADKVVVVLGHEADRVREVLRGLDDTGKLQLVYNERYEEGMSSSIKAGLHAVDDAAEAVIILPGDYALMTSRPIDALIKEYQVSGGPILIASFQGKRGHPILIDRSLFDEVKEINEETMGLRKVVRAHSNEVKLVEVNSKEVLIDIDTFEDYARYVERAGHGPR